MNRYHIKIKTGEIKVGKRRCGTFTIVQVFCFCRLGVLIETKTQLDVLMSRGIFYASARIPDKSLAKKSDLLEEVSPFQLIDQIYPRLEKLLCSSTPETEKEFPAKMMGLCRLLQQACVKDVDATLSTILLGTADRYSIKHPIDVAIVCEFDGSGPHNTVYGAPFPDSCRFDGRSQ